MKFKNSAFNELCQWTEKNIVNEKYVEHAKNIKRMIDKDQIF